MFKTGPVTAEREVWTVVAGVLRSLNNLEEHLHQSHWYYLMVGPRHFVPLSVYIAPCLVMWAAYVGTGAQLWLQQPAAPPSLVRHASRLVALSLVRRQMEE